MLPLLLLLLQVSTSVAMAMGEVTEGIDSTLHPLRDEEDEDEAVSVSVSVAFAVGRIENPVGLRPAPLRLRWKDSAMRDPPPLVSIRLAADS